MVVGLHAAKGAKSCTLIYSPWKSLVLLSLWSKAKLSLDFVIETKRAWVVWDWFSACLDRFVI